MGLSRESDDGWVGAGCGEVVEVKSAIPAGGNEDLVFRGVDNAPHWLRVFTHDGLFAGLEVDPALITPISKRTQTTQAQRGCVSLLRYSII